MVSIRTLKVSVIVCLMLVSTVPLGLILANPDGAIPVYDDTFDLVARRTSTAPVIDGSVDAVWNGADVLRAQTQGESGVPVINMRAMFDDDYIYLLSSWDEPNFPVAPAEDVEREAWFLTSNSTPGTWNHTDWGEDRISFFFEDPDSPVQGFDVQGCDAICHDLVDMHTVNAGEMLDAWVWSAATTNPQGYADDGVLLNNNSVTKDPKRMHVTLADLDWDPGADGWWVNNDTANATERPTHVWKPGATPADPRFMFIDDAQSVDWDTFDISTIPQGTFVPGHVLMTPGGDRADVQAKGVFNGTGWNVEFKRLRDTGSDNDVAFDRTNVDYVFAPAFTNNLTGDKHSKGIHEYHMWLAEPEDPDLTISNILAIGSSPTVNSTITVGVRVENVGWADAGASQLSWRWDEAGAPAAVMEDSPAVPWGKWKYIQFNVSTDGLMPGNNTLVVMADAGGDVTEINETNNEANRTVLLGEEVLSNLRVDSITLDPVEVAVEAYTDITVKVSSTGDKATPQSTIILYLDDPGSPLVSDTLPAIAKGGSDNYEFTWGPVDLAEGQYTLNVTVDPDDDIKEKDEMDNSMSTLFNVTGPTLPDLVVESVTAINTTVTQGEETRTRVVVANNGGATVTDTFQLALFLNEAFTVGTVGLVATTEVTEDIPAGGNVTLVMIWTVPGDTDVGSDNFLRAEVDWMRGIEELDESNNNGTFDGLVILRRSLPDLTVSAVSPQDPTVKMEDHVIFNISVTNVGDVASSINTTLLIKDQTHNESIDSVNLPAVPAGATVYLEYDWYVDVPTLGAIMIQFLVDPLNHIDEEDEFNNARSNSVTVEAPDLPDLTIQEEGISFSPSVPRVGDAVTISVTVKNIGTNASGDTVTVEVRLGNNRILQTDLVSLGAGESRTLDLIWAANEIQSPMTYKLDFRIDPDGRLDELDKTNNEVQENITFVKPPAPVLENLHVTVSSDKVEDGTKVTLTVSLDNSGDAADLITIEVKDGVAPVDSRQGVTVPAGGNVTETFQIKLDGTGDHSLGVTIYRGSEVVQDPSGSDLVDDVTVKVTDKGDDGNGSSLMLVIIIVVILVIVGVAAYFMFMRK
jgi:subtilase family serine protease